MHLDLPHLTYSGLVIDELHDEVEPAAEGLEQFFDAVLADPLRKASDSAGSMRFSGGCFWLTSRPPLASFPESP
jgi:hypothetical protein